MSMIFHRQTVSVFRRLQQATNKGKAIEELRYLTDTELNTNGLVANFFVDHGRFEDATKQEELFRSSSRALIKQNIVLMNRGTNVSQVSKCEKQRDNLI